MIPIGYVTFTVPYPIMFFSAIGGRSMPYYDPEIESLWVEQFAGAQIWGFEYVLAHHFEQNQQVQAFPSETTVVQRVSRDGLVEWADGVDQPIFSNFFEELRLYAGETLDIHAHYLGSRNVAIRRAEIGLLVESAVMSQAFTPGVNHALLRDLSAEEEAFFFDSLTLDTFDFWQLAIDISGIPTHRHTWWSSTYDPVQGAAVTWNSGRFDYEADSEPRLCSDKKSPQVRRTQSVMKREREVTLDGEKLRIRQRGLSRGPGKTWVSFEFRRTGLDGSLTIGGSQDLEWKPSHKGISIGRVELRFGDVREPVWRGDILVLPRSGYYSVGFASEDELQACEALRVLLSAAR